MTFAWIQLFKLVYRHHFSYSTSRLRKSREICFCLHLEPLHFSTCIVGSLLRPPKWAHWLPDSLSVQTSPPPSHTHTHTGSVVLWAPTLSQWAPSQVCDPPNEEQPFTGLAYLSAPISHHPPSSFLHFLHTSSLWVYTRCKLIRKVERSLPEDIA